MKDPGICAACLLVALSAGSLAAKEYVVPAGDVGRYFARLPADATYLSFSDAATYTSNGDIVLPAVPLLVIDGKGCKLQLGPGSNGFTSDITDQKQATARVTGRVVIRDFAMIQGGRKAIDLQATLGSEVRNVKLVGQTEAAIDLRFCLMARLEHVFVTNPMARGIVVQRGLAGRHRLQQPEQQHRAGTMPRLCGEDHHRCLYRAQQRRCVHERLRKRGCSL